MIAQFDLVVVGAGPGGIAAAVLAAEAGLRVCLVDDNPAPGGQIWRGKAEKDRRARRWMERLRASGCTVWPGMRVVSVPAERVLRLEGNEAVRDVAYKQLILATGARERFLPFPGWTLPGVMGAGAAQAFLKAGLEVGNTRAVVAGSGPLLLAVAAALRQQGARVAAICEQAPVARLAGFGARLWRSPAKLLEGARYRLQAGLAPYRTGCWVVKAEGRGRLERVTVSNGLRQWTMECNLLACGFNLVPNLELPLLLGCSVMNGVVQVNAMRESTKAGVYCIGELTGVGGLEKALVEGQIAGYSAAGKVPEAQRLQKRLPGLMSFVNGLERAFELRPELRLLPQPGTLICRCEDVSYGALCSRSGWRDAKLQTRAGMGACQGRVCGAAAEFLLGWNSRDVRPPLFPASVGAMAAEVSALASIDASPAFRSARDV
jgi:NADPH-dependent 2,4-dienoyl-CoA reductase/sulfur reductase-like enzyme